MSVTEYPRQSFEKMSRKQAIATCYALEDMRDKALVRLSEVNELTAGTTHLDRVGSTHWADCYKDHHDCLVVRIRAALDGES